MQRRFNAETFSPYVRCTQAKRFAGHAANTIQSWTPFGTLIIQPQDNYLKIVKCPAIKHMSMWRSGTSPPAPQCLSWKANVSDLNVLSSSHHNSSSWSRSAGFSSPPTFMRRSRSASSAAFWASSRSSAKSSELSPENSLSWIRKSLRSSLNLGKSVLKVNRPSTKRLIWALRRY